MTQVVDFPKPETVIWVCACGCSTFNLRNDGEAVCANCDSCVVGAAGGWHEKVACAGEYQGETPPFNDVQGNGSVEFALRRIARMAVDDDIVMAVLARGDGRLHAWFAAEGEQQERWTKERLEEAKGLLLVKGREE